MIINHEPDSFMKPLFAKLLLAALLLGSAAPLPAAGPAYRSDRQKEQLGRGMVAIHRGEGRVTVSWRLLESDSVTAAFDLYRRTGRGREVKLNSEPIAASTFFVDLQADPSRDNTYTLRPAGDKRVCAAYTLRSAAAQRPYLVIPLQQAPGDEEWRYTPNDATVGDLDGDGEYEIILKRETRGFDNSHRGLSGAGVLLEAYKLDGTFLWRVDLGENIRQGAHYTQLSLYDFDGDGRAELAVKTAEGTVFGDGSVIGDTDGDGRTDYVDRDPQSPTYGMILQGPEFLSVIDGLTGRELARADFISRGEPFEFGDNKGNRVDRFLGGAGYFDGERPSILICRGYYAKTVLEAWDYRDGQLTRRWRFDTSADGGRYRDYEGQGNHNLSIGDVDGDGFDEVTYGACMIDHDGTPGYNTRLGHGDAMHLTDIDIDRPGLEVWQCHESAPLRAGSELRDAATGQVLWGVPSIEDVGRAMAADIDPAFRGVEVWTSSTEGVYTADGRFITETKPSVNMGIWWDGDLNRELLDNRFIPAPGSEQVEVSWDTYVPSAPPAGRSDRPGAPAGNRPRIFGDRVVSVTKWNGDGVDELPLPDQESALVNNGTKANPCLAADLFGDWREEIVVRSKDNRELRIYMTDYPTDYRFYSLMTDPIYRMGVLTQNVAYNQPPHTGFYLGSDLGKFWPVVYRRNPEVAFNGKSGTGSDGRKNGMRNRRTAMIETELRDLVLYGRDRYRLDARCDYDRVVWRIDGQPAGEGRYCEITAAECGYDRPVTVEIEATIHGAVFRDRGTVTFSTAARPRPERP